ncbi:unnamed protein product [Tilletia controversa]|uniref:Uncharacterized protein n=2 Tax=Tilletia TaxID=13289 RepID=A0A177VH87_9BASI|nr:hypothetical protein CF336_g2484 [Tilletia laevis]KAE8262922.1 hypothetical protein A4X03_0g2073 [Tilletia caries]CAD6912812.1 unnamed protein product [Tilletia controversa]KAE8206550.1 hypothetical protein CF335_g1802 [Tilletia laevis]CAD6887036.1 unnamed protein product [Tilletia caries]
MGWWDDNNDLYEDYSGGYSRGLNRGYPDFDSDSDPGFDTDSDGLDDKFSGVPLLASTAHPQVRDALRTEDLSGKNLGKAMIEAIYIQLKLHAEQDVKYQKVIVEQDEDIILSITQPGSGDGKDNVLPSAPGKSDVQEPPALFAQAAARVAIELGRASEAEARVIAKRVPHVASPGFGNIIWKLPRLPYTVFHQAVRNASKVETSQGSTRVDEPVKLSQRAGAIDEWIIRNEKYMRARLVLDQPREGGSSVSPANEEESPSLSQLGIDRSASHWKKFMVGLGRDAKRVFTSGSDTETSSSSTIRFRRPDKADLPGLLLLDQYRKNVVEINTLSTFQSRFDSMTFEVLKGLDWRNVLVAGGISLAALTSVTDQEAQKSESSDVDLYLYGLTVDQANAKLQEIEKVFVSNLPLDNNTGKPIEYAVLRNAQTITFVPGIYPYRRIQVVLKLCPNPMAILLNFDLDQVAIGYTGDEVWMLPRASRALVTGYTTFTMDLIHGSFLAPRKATQDQRVFKYAERGYGLRFLPSYIEALPIVPLKQKTTTEKKVPEKSLARDELNVTLREERERVAWWLAHRFGAFISPLSQRELCMHDMTYKTGSDTAELAEKSSMSGWQLFARHVALWELAQLGYCRLKEQEKKKWTGGSDYTDDTLSYDDVPDYDWDYSFTLDKLKQAVDRVHESDEENLRNTLEPSRYHGLLGQRDECRIPLRRHVLASSLKGTFALPLVSAVHIPRNLHDHAEAQLQRNSSRFVKVARPPTELERAYAERETSSLRRTKVVRTPARLDGSETDGDSDGGDGSDDDEHSEEDEYSDEEDYDDYDSYFTLLYWIQGLDSSSSLTPKDAKGPSKPHWQLVSRKQDEIHEVLHAFRRAHRDTRMPADLRNQSVRRQVSRRLVCPTERSERDAFVRWAGERTPQRKSWPAECAMLTMSRDTVFRRFEKEWDELEKVDTRKFLVDGFEDSTKYDDADNIKTAGEWISRMGGNDDPKRGKLWELYSRQRIPPAHFLPTLNNAYVGGPIHLRLGKRKR